MPTSAQSVFDHINRIYLAAVEGPPTKANIALALEILACVPAQSFDVRAMAFSPRGGVPPAALRTQLTQEHGVGVVHRQDCASACQACETFRAEILALAAQAPLAQRLQGSAHSTI